MSRIRSENIKTGLAVFTGIVASVLLFYGFHVFETRAFEGPGFSPGSGGGAILVDGGGNLSIGTSTVLADTRLLIFTTSTQSAHFGIRVFNKTGGPVLVVRNDGKVSINTGTFSPTSTLRVAGEIESTTGGFRFPDGTTQTTAAGASQVLASNVSAGGFGANWGGGNFSFPASLGVQQASPSAPLDIGVTTETAIEFDNGGARITIHDGYGNFNIKAGVDDDNIIDDGTTGGSHIRMDSAGYIHLWIDESTAPSGTFAADAGITINGGTVSFIGGINASNLRITSLAEPTAASDAATKNYVDTAASGAGSWTLSTSNLYPNSTSWNVGIGTISPGVRLDVVSASGQSAAKIDLVNASADTVLELSADDGVIGGGSNFLRWSDGGIGLGVIRGDGYVGIGTTGPRYQEEILGSGQLTSAITDAGGTGGTLSLLGQSTTAGSGGALLFGNSQSQTAASAGFAGIKGLLTNGAGNTTGDLAFSTRNSTVDTALIERMIIKGGGNVGIGVSGPSYKLQVDGGNIGVSGGIYSSDTSNLAVGKDTGDFFDFRDGTDFLQSDGVWEYQFASNNFSPYFSGTTKDLGGSGAGSRWNTIYGTAANFSGGTSRFEYVGSNVNVANFVGGADDTAYEWVGFYSGATRYGIHIWDKSWSICAVDDTYCIAADGGKNLQLAAAGGTIYVQDLLELRGNRITNVGTPTVSTDAATKDYVDTNVKIQYMGITTAVYTGNLGGLAGANAKCQLQYSGSHMCSQGEMLRSGATSFGGAGGYSWVSCDIVHGDTCDGVTFSFTNGLSPTCSQFTSALSSYSGPGVDGTYGRGGVSGFACDGSRSIHCCK